MRCSRLIYINWSSNSMITRRSAVLGIGIASLVAATTSLANEPSSVTSRLHLTRKKVELVAPPFVHPHEQATRATPKIIEFRLVIQEKEIVIDDQGTKLQAMTFNGSIPGPMMVVHEGDYVEVTLVNPATN